MGAEDQFIREHAYVAASQTDQQLGAQKGGIIERIIVVPATLAPGVVSYKDGSGGAARTVSVGGAASLLELKPFVVELGIRGAGLDGFHITTGANLSVIVVGRFNTV